VRYIIRSLVNRISQLALPVLFLSAMAGQGQPQDESERLYRLGQQQLVQGNLEEAEQAFRGILESRPDLPEVHYYLGKIEVARGEYQTAVGHYERALSFNANFPEALNDLGLARMAGGNVDAAEKAFRNALRLQPAQPYYRLNLAYCLLGQARTREAGDELESIRPIPESDPAFETAWEIWVQMMTEKEEYESAVQRLQRHLDRTPDSVHLHLLLGQMLFDSGAFKKAEAEFSRAMRLAPEASRHRSRVSYSLGYLYVQLGRGEKGEEFLRKALARDPSNVSAQTALGSLLLDLGRWDKGEELLTQALRAQPDFSEARFHLGRCYVKQKKWSESTRVLAEMVEKQPQHLEAHFLLSKAYRGQGLLTQAAHHFQVFRELEKMGHAMRQDKTYLR